jgi:hypothetical protein
VKVLFDPQLRDAVKKLPTRVIKIISQELVIASAPLTNKLVFFRLILSCGGKNSLFKGTVS